MNYSYTQIAPFFPSAIRGRQHPLRGEPPQGVRASLWYGRAFERALAALFRHEDAVSVLFQQWALCKYRKLVYPAGDSWDSMWWQGIKLLERFVQDGRVEVPDPGHQQLQFRRRLSSGNQFIAIIDAIGKLDGTTCLLEWKTASIRYPVNVPAVTELDPQLLCYSWVTGIEHVAQVVFARTCPVEVQYLQSVITSETRQKVLSWVEGAVRQLKSGLPPARFDMRGAHIHCPGSSVLTAGVEAAETPGSSLLHPPGVDLGLFDELAY